MTLLMEQPLDADRMIGVRNAADPVRLPPKLVRLPRGWPVMVLPLPAGLAGRGTRPVTLYTPDGPQPRMLGTPMVVEVGRPRPVEAPGSKVTGTGMGIWLPEVEVEVSAGAGGHATTSYAGKIWDMAADRSGNVWVATEAGLSRFDGRQWTTFTEADGLADDLICSVAVDGQGRVWAGSLNGLSRFDGQYWTRYQFEERGYHHAVAPNGEVWCSGSGGGYLLARFDGQDWWTYDLADIGTDAREDRFDHLSVTEIAVDGSGTLWAMAHFWQVLDEVGGLEKTWTRLLTFDGRQWTWYRLAVRMLLADRAGRVWVDCGEGLYVKEGAIWKRYDRVGTGDEVGWDEFCGVAEDAGVEDCSLGVLEGAVWIGFPYEEFRAMGAPVVDSRGDLWIPSYEGLYRWCRSELPTALESSSRPGEPCSIRRRA